MWIPQSVADYYVNLCHHHLLLQHRQRIVFIAVHTECVNCMPCRTSFKKIMQVALANSMLGIHSLEGDDSLIRYYTGFPSFRVFRAFYAFLGLSVDQLTYGKR